MTWVKCLIVNMGISSKVFPGWTHSSPGLATSPLRKGRRVSKRLMPACKRDGHCWWSDVRKHRFWGMYTAKRAWSNEVREKGLKLAIVES